MLQAQRDLMTGYVGYKVAYKDNSVGGEELKPGYALVLDPSEDLEPQAGEWSEQQLGRTFVKANGNNRNQRTVIVVETPQRLKHGSLDDFSSVDVKVVDCPTTPVFWALVDNVSYTEGSTLQVADGEYYLEVQAAGPTAQTINTRTVAKVLKTLNLSGESGPTLMLVGGV